MGAGRAIYGPQCAAKESKVDVFLENVWRKLGTRGRLGGKKGVQACKPPISLTIEPTALVLR